MTKVYLNATIARNFAETNWGRGGTHSYKTNRLGCYYYSCSGHGGYVVDGNALTDSERANINQYVTPDQVYVTVSSDNKVKMQNPNALRGFPYRRSELVATDHPIYFFEEDCQWALLEYFTDIRHDGGTPDHDSHIQPTFDRWIAPNKKQTV